MHALTATEYQTAPCIPELQLSDLELKIVAGLLRHQKPEHIAHQVGISPRTFEYCCAKLMRLMNFEEVGPWLDALHAEARRKDIIE